MIPEEGEIVLPRKNARRLYAGESVYSDHLCIAGAAWSYQYDGCGNMLNGAGRNYTWNSDNKPVKISNSAGTTATFSYGPSGVVLTDTLSGPTANQATTHIGGIYEVVQTGSSNLLQGFLGTSTYQRCYIGGFAVVINQVSGSNSSPVATQYFHGDHLGSLEVITGDQGAVIEKFAYDPWGARQQTASSSLSSQLPDLETGFTGHEQLDDLGLVHMIGRVYDPVIGRFVSADPTVQAPGNSQSYNRYSYCINNPLSLTDPTGYSWFSSFFNSVGSFFSSVGNWFSQAFTKMDKWFSNNWKTVVVVVAVVVVSVVSFGVLTAPAIGMCSTGAFVCAGAAAGAAGAMTSTGLNGGSASQILLAGVEGAAAGAVTAGAMELGGPLLAGLAGGAINEAEGGSFQNGFLSSAVGGEINALGGAAGIGNIGGSTGFALNMVVAAAAGGATSAACGGSFVNGAVTGAMAYVVGAAMQNPQFMLKLASSALNVIGSLTDGVVMGFHLWASPGYASITGSGGTTSGVMTTSQVVGYLGSAAPGSVTNLTLTGHGWSGGINLANGSFFITTMDAWGDYQILDEKGNDVTWAFQNALNPGATVHLNGCNTAFFGSANTFAGQFNQALGIAVSGYTFFGLGIPKYGISIGPTKTFTAQ